LQVALFHGGCGNLIFFHGGNEPDFLPWLAPPFISLAWTYGVRSKSATLFLPGAWKSPRNEKNNGSLHGGKPWSESRTARE
jgi:hypothetical protein